MDDCARSERKRLNENGAKKRQLRNVGVHDNIIPRATHSTHALDPRDKSFHAETISVCTRAPKSILKVCMRLLRQQRSSP